MSATTSTITLDHATRRAHHSTWMASIAALGLCAMLAGAHPAMAQAAVTVADLANVSQGYKVSKLIGVEVTNSAGDKVGRLDDVIIDQTGVLYGVLDVGGFLGIGSHLIVEPYKNLTITDGGTKIALAGGGTKDEIVALPEFKYGATQ